MPGEQRPDPTVADVNDEFRRTTSHIVVTPGIGERDDLLPIIMAVRTYDDFNTDNDPYGEHDYGSLDWHDERVFWKIDYYDPTMSHREDPQSPNCHRLLTLGLMGEYLDHNTNSARSL